MKKIIFIACLALQYSYVLCQNIIVQPGANEITCSELQQMLDQYGTVCIIKDFSTQSNIEFFLNIDEDVCNTINIGDGQVLRIPANMDIKLRDENSFVLSGNGQISGTHFATSTIGVSPNGGEENTAVKMENCQGCEISNLTIQSNFEDPNGGATTGLEIVGEEDDSAVVNMVKFEDLDFGISVNGDNNEFSDIQFRKVAIKTDRDSGCMPEDDDPSAIVMTNSNSNTFNNITHTDSEGAITLKMDGSCSLNEIYNITLEQDGPSCSIGEPSVYIITELDTNGDILFTNNILNTNLNNGRVILNVTNSNGSNDQDLICASNLITYFPNCNGIDTALIDCSY